LSGKCGREGNGIATRRVGYGLSQGTRARVGIGGNDELGLG
jgi:hypothetical protein